MTRYLLMLLLLAGLGCGKPDPAPEPYKVCLGDGPCQWTVWVAPSGYFIELQGIQRYDRSTLPSELLKIDGVGLVAPSGDYDLLVYKGERFEWDVLWPKIKRVLVQENAAQIARE